MVTKKLYIDLYQHTIETKTMNHFTYDLKFYDTIHFRKRYTWNKEQMI